MGKMTIVYPDFLYVGTKAAAADRDVLEQFSITHIVNVMGKTNHFEGTFTYFNASSEDQPDFPINQYFDAAADFIEEARKKGGKILVHCAGGVSRSPTIALAYLVKHRDMSLLDALTEIKSYKPNCNPNDGFCRQLIDWELQNRGSVSMRFINENPNKGKNQRIKKDKKLSHHIESSKS